MLKVGLTGGIGSGKSTVAEVFTVIGIPVYMADLEARLLLKRVPEVRARIVDLLGPASYSDSGEPDRSFIADRVFRDSVLLKGLNAIIHPAVRSDFVKWSQTHDNHPYVIQEAAILFESGGAAFMDAHIMVWAPEALRLQRVMDRDGVTADQVRSRMANQMPDDEKAKKADFVVINDGAHSLIRQVMEIHDSLVYLSESESADSSTEGTGKSIVR